MKKIKRFNRYWVIGIIILILILLLINSYSSIKKSDNQEGELSNLAINSFDMVFAPPEFDEPTPDDKNYDEYNKDSPISNNLPSNDDCDSESENCDCQPERVAALFHGWAPEIRGKDIAKEGIYSLKNEMKKDSFFNKIYSDIVVITYNLDNNNEQIAQNIEKKLINLLDKRCRGTKVDIITHSVGDFAALLGTTNNKNKLKDGRVISDAVNKFVTLAGSKRGQNHKKGCRNRFINFISFPRLICANLRPYNNAINQNFFKIHKNEMEDWEKCSLYSIHDKRIDNPHNSGCFPDSQNQKCIAYNLNCKNAHMNWVKGECHNNFYNVMKKNCWADENDEAPAEDTPK